MLDLEVVVVEEVEEVGETVETDGSVSDTVSVSSHLNRLNAPTQHDIIEGCSDVTQYSSNRNKINWRLSE